MDIIFKNEFVEYAIDVEEFMSRVHYFPETENMQEAEFKEIILHIFMGNTKYQIDKSLLDFRELRFGITPHLQTWMVETLKDYRKLKKVATIIPTDFISNLSVQQSLDEINENTPEIEENPNRYFDNEENALRWLLAD